MNSVKKKITNENFINKAPKKIVKHEQKKFNNYENDYNKLKTNLDNLIS